ncbi:NACHT domain-containing protein [Calothrix sp. 336/3]|uniref:NACHT domain-containing protein n=1 Tax=Calothrix sp. 336/3 TaxID=1337936 RepID=UPI0004E44C23|nr:NACHT domain-containing protein [Calothrix sp. 336/3]AKG23297.1 NB-ARC domain-containing protein [Calothrix sp. 336/3]
MTIIDSPSLEEEFKEAKNHWELDKLYIDLASAKGKSLTPVEKKFLRGLLCGLSPAEIANTVYQSRSSSTVRVYLSNGLYKYIEEMLSIQSGNTVKVKNWSRVTHLLEQAGYKKLWFKIDAVNNQMSLSEKMVGEYISMISTPQQDWGEAVDVSYFHGRIPELSRLKSWINQDQCRLVVLLGSAGIGKTALAVKLAVDIQEDFDFVIWRSLKFAPKPEIILSEIINFLSPDTDREINYIPRLENQISLLIDCLRVSRCLIILDGIEATFDNPQSSGNIDKFYPQIKYSPGYEGYGELIQRIGDTRHQSCLLVTTREKPQEIAILEGNTLPVRCYKLTSLTVEDSQQILFHKGLVEISPVESQTLIQIYAGNPLFLKLVATAIADLFSGDVGDFLAQNTLVFGEIRTIFDQQFSRLYNLEKQVISWLALNGEFISLSQLQKSISPPVSQRLILEAIDLLQKRCLIENQNFVFRQTPILIEYIIEQLIEANFQLAANDNSCLLMQTTVETQLKRYIRESYSQSRI